MSEHIKRVYPRAETNDPLFDPNAEHVSPPATPAQPRTAAGRYYPNGQPDMHDPAWHQDDGHGGCVACLFSIPYTDDDVVRQNWPCAVVREVEAADLRVPASGEAGSLDVLRDALALALHQSRGSNEEPEFDMDVARGRVDRMLAHPQVRAALAAADGDQ